MKIEPSFYTDEDLIELWGITRDALECLVADGRLTRSLKLLAGEQRQGIAAEERRRFEATVKGEREPMQHPAQRKGDRLLLAMMLAVWTGEDAAYIEDTKDRHYRLRDLIASDVESALGMKLARGRESDAEAIKEGFELLRARGYRPRRVATAPEPASADAAPQTPEAQEKAKAA